MKRTTLALLMFATVTAVPPGRADDAERLLQALDVPRTIQQMRPVLADQLIRTEPALAAHRDLVARYLEDAVGWEALRHPLAELYRQRFTPEELHALVAFFTSPAGRKFVGQRQELTRAIAELTTRRLRQNQARLAEMLAERVLAEGAAR